MAMTWAMWMYVQVQIRVWILAQMVRQNLAKSLISGHFCALYGLSDCIKDAVQSENWAPSLIQFNDSYVA